MTGPLFSEAAVGPSIKVMLIKPASPLGSHLISNDDPAGMTWPGVGEDMTSKPEVCATTDEDKAKGATETKEGRMIIERLNESGVSGDTNKL
jgi:hypothetical protein